MDKIFEALAEIILQNGLVGAVIASLLYALYKFVNMYHDVQTARNEDNKEAVKALVDSVTAIRDLRETIMDKQSKGVAGE